MMQASQAKASTPRWRLRWDKRPRRVAVRSVQLNILVLALVALVAAAIGTTFLFVDTFTLGSDLGVIDALRPAFLMPGGFQLLLVAIGAVVAAWLWRLAHPAALMISVTLGLILIGTAAMSLAVSGWHWTQLPAMVAGALVLALVIPRRARLWCDPRARTG